MNTIEAEFQIPDFITEGLQSGAYERVGGIVCEHGTKQVVAWLREAAPEKLINFTPKLLSGGEAFAGVLNLGISVCGFSVILSRLNKLEANLKQSQELLTQIDRKIDISFYGNFVSAIKQANAAFLMNSQENRRQSALQAIDRLLATQHHFTGLVDAAIAQDDSTTHNLLATLRLAYMAEVRCYLELEEVELALMRLDEGIEVLQPRCRRHLNQQLLNPKLLFLHPDCRNTISQPQLVSVYQWAQAGITDREVLERESKKLAKVKEATSGPTVSELAKDYKNAVTDSSTHVVARAAWSYLGLLASPVYYVGMNVKASSDNAKRADQLSLLPKLPERFNQLETVVEDANRFEAYHTEVQIIQTSGISFHEWSDLKPSKDKKDDKTDVICITNARR